MRMVWNIFELRYNTPMAMKFSPVDVTHIAKLANIPVSDEEAKKLGDGFTATLTVVEKLHIIDVKNVAKSHLAGLENVFREDVVDEKRMLSQGQALSNATNTYNGYFVVGRLIDQYNDE